MIVFDKATKNFGNGMIALEEVSFSVDPGELLVITGPSGSGKTTLMRLLIKEYLLTSGDVKFENVSLDQIKNSDLPAHRRKVGVVFQDYKLMPELNVWENIALPLSIAGKPDQEIESRVTDLLKLISLSDKAFVFPNQLSGGEAQRVSIARALATAPSVIFADEPTGNLDKESSINIAELLRKINQFGTTLLFATHDSNILDLFAKERKISLFKGKLVEDTGRKEGFGSKDVGCSEPEKEGFGSKDVGCSEPVVEKKAESSPSVKDKVRGFKLDLTSVSNIWPFGKSDDKMTGKQEDKIEPDNKMIGRQDDKKELDDKMTGRQDDEKEVEKKVIKKPSKKSKKKKAKKSV